MAKAKARVVKKTYGINATAPSTQPGPSHGIIHVHDNTVLRELPKYGHRSVYYSAEEYQLNTLSTAGYYDKFQYLAQQIDKCRRTYITPNDVTPSSTRTNQKSQAGTPTTNNGVEQSTDKSVHSIAVDQSSQIQSANGKPKQESHVQDDVQQQAASMSPHLIPHPQELNDGSEYLVDVAIGQIIKE
jgi:hypothetical protein